MSAATCPQTLAPRVHGSPNWVDLHTTKAPLAADFYASVLGWTLEPDRSLTAVADPPLGPPRRATTVQVDGLGVGEIVGRSDCFDSAQLLSNWFPFVQVDDIEWTLDLVEPAGGLVLSPVATRGDGARVATILDPSDAVLRLWDRPLGGGHRSTGPGSPAWFELETSDLDRACKFYAELFGWDAGEVDDPNGSDPYLVFTREGDAVAGAVGSPLADIPASWCTAFTVADADEATDRAVAAGGVVLTEPSEMVRGRQSVVVDPTGAVFGLLGPAATGPRPL